MYTEAEMAGRKLLPRAVQEKHGYTKFEVILRLVLMKLLIYKFIFPAPGASCTPIKRKKTCKLDMETNVTRIIGCCLNSSQHSHYLVANEHIAVHPFTIYHKTSKSSEFMHFPPYHRTSKFQALSDIPLERLCLSSLRVSSTKESSTLRSSNICLACYIKEMYFV